MPATATGRGAQVVLDPQTNTTKAVRGAYASTFEANAAKVAADVAAGIAADGYRPDGTTNTGATAVDIDVNPAATASITGSMIIGTSAGPVISSGTGVASGTQPSGSIFIRTDGAAGARIYVSQGGGTWIAIATV
jgi:hypothetical protein